MLFHTIRWKAIAIAVSIIPIVFACDDSVTNSDGDTELLPIAEQTQHESTIRVYANDSLTVGYNEIYLGMDEDLPDDPPSMLDLQITPLMHMAEMTHSAPVEQPEKVEVNEETMYKGVVYFIMPSMGEEYWELNVTTGRTDTEFSMVVDVNTSNLQYKHTTDSTTYFVTYIGPEEPVVGGDTYEFAIHKKQDMMHFPAVTDFTVQIDPFMDMGGGEGHGPTSYDANAIHTGRGHYSGSINYNMSGEWELTVLFGPDADHLTSHTFTIRVASE